MTGRAPAPAPALGYSVVVNLDGNRQLTMQCFVAEDEPAEVVNAKLDRVFAVIDRQKARYDIVGEREELEKESAALAQFEEDLARVDADFEKAQAGLREQVVEMTTQKTQALEGGYNQHNAAGRRGEYVPSGHTKQTVNAAEAALRNVAETLHKNEAERDQHRLGVEISIDRYHKAIAARKERIATLEKTLG